ncbi:MAG: hypothetical protein MJH11_16830, partial [Lentisphaeria bacterium]|nr:hypothetical protein [Lentisphaeria bacterium]
ADIIDITTITASAGGMVTISGEGGDDYIRVVSALGDLTIHGNNKDANSTAVVSDDDVIFVDNNSADLIINGNDGTDAIYLRANSGDATIDTAAGDSFVKIGATAPTQWTDYLTDLHGGNTAATEAANTENSGDMSGITGTISVTGLAAGSNVLEFNDDAHASGHRFVLEDAQLIIVHDDDTYGQITYTNTDFLNLFMGSGADQVDILSTHLNTDTFILADLGNDTFNLGATVLPDTVIGLAADLNDNDSLMSALLGYLRLDANAGYNGQTIDQHADIVANPSVVGGDANTWTGSGGYDTINIFNDGAAAVLIGRISNTQIDGFGVSDFDTDGTQSDVNDYDGSLRYFDFDNMAIKLGDGDDILDIVGVFEGHSGKADYLIADNTGANRQLSIDAGDSTIENVINIGTGEYMGGGTPTDVDGLPDKPALAGNYVADSVARDTEARSGTDGIFSDITILDGDGFDVVYLDDSQNTQQNTIYITATTVEGIGRTADNSGSYIFNYTTALDELNIYLGQFDDRVFIENTFINTTNIIGNGGSDTILADNISGTFNFEGDSTTEIVTDGADHVFIDNISANAIVTISTQSGNDIVDITNIEVGSGSVSVQLDEGNDYFRAGDSSTSSGAVVSSGVHSQLTVNANDGEDLIFIDYATAQVIINGDDGNDRIYVRSNSAAGLVTINAGTGQDFIKFGAEAPDQWQTYLNDLETAHKADKTTILGGSIAGINEDPNIENAGNIDRLLGDISVDGSDAVNNNRLEINDDAGNASIFRVDDNEVELNNGAVITYSNIDYFNLFMSAGDDVVSIMSTFATTDYFVLGDTGDDTFNLGSTGGRYNDSVMDHLDGYLRIDGNAGYNREFITTGLDFENALVVGLVTLAAYGAGTHKKNTWTNGGYDTINIFDDGTEAGVDTNTGRISNTQIDG